MTKPPVDITAEIERLQALGTETLRYEWRRHHQTPPPKRLSRELLLRGITYRIQERTFGGLSKSVLRRMSAAAAETPSGSNRMAPQTLAKPGTRFVREWNGETHTVLVHADGVEWRGTRYRSLSIVAREITGTHWSGPRFFGLTSKNEAGDG